MSGYGVEVGYPQRYYYVPGKNPRDCGWRPGIILPKTENSKDSLVKNTLAATGFVATTALVLGAILKPALFKDIGKVLSKHKTDFLAKHPNLTQGLTGFKNILKGWADTVGQKLVNFAKK